MEEQSASPNDIQRVLVTGGAGFIGANLCRRLVDRGHTVTAFDDLSTGFEDNLTGVDAPLTVGSILDRDALGRAVDPADAVVHLAARPSVPRSITDPIASHEVNATGTLNVLEAARHERLRHVIVAGSSSVYGSNPSLPKHEELATRPISPYAASKWAVIGLTKTWAMELGERQIRVNAICPGTVGGLRMDGVIEREAEATNSTVEAVTAGYARQVSMNTLITGADIGEACAWLLSAAARFVSGQVLSVDGNTETLRNI